MVFSARRPQSGGAFDREFTQTRALKRLPFVLLILPKSLLCLETGQVHNSELRSPIAKASTRRKRSAKGAFPGGRRQKRILQFEPCRVQ
jgi:hypothetical protein